MQRYQGLLSFTALALLPMAVGCGGSSIEGSGVAAATAVRVETHVSAHEIDVGGRFDVRCQLLDVDGAEVAGAATFRVDPAEFVLDGLSVIPNGPGDYEVTCFSVDGVLVDETPETVTVVAGGVPRVLTRLPAETIPSCSGAVGSELWRRLPPGRTLNRARRNSPPRNPPRTRPPLTRAPAVGLP